MKRCYPINQILRQIASTIPLQFEEVDFQMQLDACLQLEEFDYLILVIV